MRKSILAMIAMAASPVFAQEFRLNESGYFNSGNADVMVFSDVYPEGHQGGVTIAVSDNRHAANGDVRFEVSPGQWQGLPRVRKRTVDEDENSISVLLSYPDSSKHLAGFNPMLYPDFDFTYTVKVQAQGDCLVLTVDLDRPVPERFAGKLGFNLELEPSKLLGQPWIMDSETGIFPHQSTGPTMHQESNTMHLLDYTPRGRASLDLLIPDRNVYNPMVADDVVSAPLAQGHSFVLNPHDNLSRISIESQGGELKLYDGRINHNNGWFVLRTEFPAGTEKNAVKWIIRPTVTKGYRYEPVVQTSQVGYHPDQQKMAVIELDAKDKKYQKVQLYRIEADGKKLVRQEKPSVWGKFMRYNYLQFDFSDIKEEGLYQVCYENSESPVFRIAKDVWQRGIWQTEIEYFLPIQMCHMRVNEKYRVWHDLCHMDDAVMAKTGINHIDGYSQGNETLCEYQPGDYVPGLAVGGWHDAGDYDLRIETQVGEAYLLGMMFENLGAYWDETSIDFENHIVEMHQPDGRNDVLQQVENGALTVVAGWKSLGRLYRGIICPTVRQYVHLGDASAHTDHILGTADDRWVFTENNPGRELETAACLAGISRVLKGFNDTLSVQCLDIAQQIYASIPSEGRSAMQKVRAAVELFLTTGRSEYKDFVLSQQEGICRSISQTGWYIGRFDKAVGNAEFSKAIRDALPSVQKMYQDNAAKTPYGVPHDRGNSSSGSWEPQHLGYNYAWLNQSYPDLFPPEYMFASMQYLLGMHPGRNQASFVTGVGAETMKQAYGVNRADWSYLPGGVAPGTNRIRPDLPELLHFPYLWQEGEYCLDGHSSWFTYMALAADRVLNP
ncbi:MAG: glycoside hydrolase family 9 protein [Bacteroidaceae bacterium]|nr:glycoside hydrolase family 9 protein [Bacteroidaceae bacterium]